MIRPLGARVLLKKVEAEEKTVGGLILTSQSKSEPQFAEVVAVGPGTEEEPMNVKVGDKVLFAKFGGTDVKYEGKEYTVMPLADILAVIE
ncbi:MAG: co-chaperone GroES [Clostridia bacterium]|nr:co-chaperone GroES [Clostridia bacterium]